MNFARYSYLDLNGELKLFYCKQLKLYNFVVN